MEENGKKGVTNHDPILMEEDFSSRAVGREAGPCGSLGCGDWKAFYAAGLRGAAGSVGQAIPLDLDFLNRGIFFFCFVKNQRKKKNLQAFNLLVFFIIIIP